MVRLWTDNLRMRGDPRDKFRWYYSGNPLGPAHAFLLECERESAGRQVVGCCGIGPRLLHARGRALRAALFADFAIDKGHRTVMPALMVQRRITEYTRAEFDTAYAFPNSAAVGVFGRIGYRLLGRAGRYVKLLRHAGFLRRYLRHAGVARAAARVPDALTATAERVRASVLPRRLALQWTRQIDARFDRLADEARHTFPNLGDRSSQFLRWRFTERPGVPSEVAALVDGETGEVRAYAAVVRKVEGVALVADFLGRREEDLANLFRALAPALRERGFDSSVAYFLGDPRVSRLLEEEGFLFRNLAKHVVVSSGPGLPAELDRVENWYLTEADRDN